MDNRGGGDSYMKIFPLHAAERMEKKMNSEVHLVMDLGLMVVRAETFFVPLGHFLISVHYISCLKKAWAWFYIDLGFVFFNHLWA